MRTDRERAFWRVKMLRERARAGVDWDVVVINIGCIRAGRAWAGSSTVKQDAERLTTPFFSSSVNHLSPVRPIWMKFFCRIFPIGRQWIFETNSKVLFFLAHFGCVPCSEWLDLEDSGVVIDSLTAGINENAGPGVTRKVRCPAANNPINEKTFKLKRQRLTVNVLFIPLTCSWPGTHFVLAHLLILLMAGLIASL